MSINWFMSWTTLYVKGKDGFKKEVLAKLGDSWLHGTSEAWHDLLMFWLKDNSKLRDFKMAIGSKIIFKYRLQFFTDLDEHLQLDVSPGKKELSRRENEMVREMLRWEDTRGSKIQAGTM